MKPPRTRIVVPTRPCQAGMFEKFEEDTYDMDLKGIMTEDEYKVAIAAINKRIRKARPGKVDGVLLAAGPLMVPLMIWGVRHSRQMKKRKRYLNQGIEEFNANNPSLLMRWNRKPKSILTIEQREGQDPTAMAEAQFVGDMVIQAMPQQTPPPQMMMMQPPQYTQAQIPPAPNGPQYNNMIPPPQNHGAAASSSSGLV